MEVFSLFVYLICKSTTKLKGYLCLVFTVSSQIYLCSILPVCYHEIN